VDAKGNVKEAHWTDQGTQNANAAMLRMAEEAALNAKFTEGEREQYGYITFIFTLN
jgi:hypothetical protein